MTKPDLGEELCCCVALGKYWCDVHNPSPTPQGEIAGLVERLRHMAHNLSINRHRLGSGVEPVLLEADRGDIKQAWL
jgi:hypothetical protein